MNKKIILFTLFILFLSPLFLVSAEEQTITVTPSTVHKSYSGYDYYMSSGWEEGNTLVDYTKINQSDNTNYVWSTSSNYHAIERFEFNISNIARVNGFDIENIIEIEVFHEGYGYRTVSSVNKYGIMLGVKDAFTGSWITTDTNGFTGQWSHTSTTDGSLYATISEANISSLINDIGILQFAVRTNQTGTSTYVYASTDYAKIDITYDTDHTWTSNSFTIYPFSANDKAYRGVTQNYTASDWENSNGISTEITTSQISSPDNVRSLMYSSSDVNWYAYNRFEFNISRIARDNNFTIYDIDEIKVFHEGYGMVYRGSSYVFGTTLGVKKDSNGVWYTSDQTGLTGTWTHTYGGDGALYATISQDILDYINDLGVLQFGARTTSSSKSSGAAYVYTDYAKVEITLKETPTEQEDLLARGFDPSRDKATEKSIYYTFGAERWECPPYGDITLPNIETSNNTGNTAGATDGYDYVTFEFNVSEIARGDERTVNEISQIRVYHEGYGRVCATTCIYNIYLGVKKDSNGVWYTSDQTGLTGTWSHTQGSDGALYATISQDIGDYVNDNGIVQFAVRSWYSTGGNAYIYTDYAKVEVVYSNERWEDPISHYAFSGTRDKAYWERIYYTNGTNYWEGFVGSTIKTSLIDQSDNNTSTTIYGNNNNYLYERYEINISSILREDGYELEDIKELKAYREGAMVSTHTTPNYQTTFAIKKNSTGVWYTSDQGTELVGVWTTSVPYGNLYATINTNFGDYLNDHGVLQFGVRSTNYYSSYYYSSYTDYIKVDIRYNVQKVVINDPETSLVPEILWSQARGGYPPYNHRLKVSTSPTFSTLVINESVGEELSYQVEFGELLSNTTYYAKVITTDDDSDQANSSVVSWTTDPFLAVTIIPPFNNLTPTIEWTSPVGGASPFTHRLKVSKYSNFSSLEINQVTTDQNYTVGSGVLLPNTTYYAKVITTDNNSNQANSSVVSWTTEAFTSTTINPPSTILTPTLTWTSPVGGISPYSHRLKVSKFNNFSSTVVNTVTGETLTYSIGAGVLEPDTVYYAKVISTDSGSNQANSSVVSWTTDLFLPVIISPIDPILEPTISWTSPVGGISPYSHRLKVSKFNNFSSTVVNTVTGETLTYSIGAGVLEPDTVYYAKVISTDSGSNDSNSATMSWSTNPFLAPELDQPIETNYLPTLSWGGVSGGSPPYEYTLKISLALDFSHIIVNIDCNNSTSYTVEEETILPNTTYYAKVITTDFNSNQANSSVVSWTTDALETVEGIITIDFKGITTNTDKHYVKYWQSTTSANWGSQTYNELSNTSYEDIETQDSEVWLFDVAGGYYGYARFEFNMAQVAEENNISIGDISKVEVYYSGHSFGDTIQLGVRRWDGVFITSDNTGITSSYWSHTDNYPTRLSAEITSVSEFIDESYLLSFTVKGGLGKDIETDYVRLHIYYTEATLATEPIITSPTNGITTSTSPTITWTRPVGGVGPYRSYIQVSDSLTFDDIIISTDTLEYFYRIPYGILDTGTTYYVRVRCQGSDMVFTLFSNEVSFITENLLIAPSITTPVSGSVTLLTFTLQWDTAIGGTGNYSYHLEIDNDMEFRTPEVNVTTDDLNYTLVSGQLRLGEVYLVRLKAIDDSGEESTYEMISFTVVNSISSLHEPTIGYPKEGGTMYYEDLVLWSNAYGGSPPYDYTLQISDSVIFLTYDEVETSDLTYGVTRTISAGKKYIRVKATDSLGAETSWSVVRMCYLSDVAISERREHQDTMGNFNDFPEEISEGQEYSIKVEFVGEQVRNVTYTLKVYNEEGTMILKQFTKRVTQTPSDYNMTLYVPEETKGGIYNVDIYDEYENLVAHAETKLDSKDTSVFQEYTENVLKSEYTLPIIIGITILGLGIGLLEFILTKR